MVCKFATIRILMMSVISGYGLLNFVIAFLELHDCTTCKQIMLEPGNCNSFFGPYRGV